MDPVDPNLFDHDRERLRPRNVKLLNALRTGPKTNIELVPIAGIRASARVHDLRKHGFNIKAEPLDRGVWKYTLVTS